LVPWLLRWSKPDLVFDTTVHLGTLVAIVSFFYRDLWALFVAWVRSVRNRDPSPPLARLAWLILLGTFPAALLGYLFEDFFESLFGQPLSVSVFLVITGLMLFLSERTKRRQDPMDSLGWIDAVVIGLAQACAIAPGISRSGATIAAGLSRGLRREDAARFSFLLSAPMVLGSGLFQLKDVLSSTAPALQWTNLGIGFLASAVSGYVFIRFLMDYLQRHSLYPFAIYCGCAGALGIALALLGTS
jgi:undecaprenyl-diphosphatase